MEFSWWQWVLTVLAIDFIWSIARMIAVKRIRTLETKTPEFVEQEVPVFIGTPWTLACWIGRWGGVSEPVGTGRIFEPSTWTGGIHLPSGWKNDFFGRIVLAHELGHVKNGDLRWDPIQETTPAVSQTDVWATMKREAAADQFAATYLGLPRFVVSGAIILTAALSLWTTPVQKLIGIFQFFPRAFMKL